MRFWKHRHSYRISKLQRFSASALIVCMLCASIGAMFVMPVNAETDDTLSLDEGVAIGIYGTQDQSQDSMGEGSGAAAESLPELLPGADHFNEALVQEYKLIGGTYELTSQARWYIVTDAADENGNAVPDQKLLETVRLMAGEMAAAGLPTGVRLQVAYGTEEGILPGDIVIRMPEVKDFLTWRKAELIDQSYTIKIMDNIEITGSDADGIYYGLLTLMQLALEHRAPETGTIRLNCCRIADGPDLEERTLFLDCGRKYFSPEWLKALIRRSSFQRYNTIVLHFSEAEGLRLDSRVFPWLTEGIDSLSMDEMADIVRYARRYHMNVIPSIDVPGHNNYMVRKYGNYVKKHPDYSFTYDGIEYNRKTRGFSSIANHYERDGVTRKVTDIGINITKQHAIAFANALIDDYAEFFRDLGCTDFDICGDEVMGWSNFMLGENEVSYEDRWLFLEHWRRYARKTLGISKGSASDTFITYLNSVCGRLQEMGYTCRVFNDEIDINKDQHTELDPSIGIACWDLKDNGAKHFADKGHTVYNCVMQWSYYVVRMRKGADIMTNRYKTVNAENIYENWDPRSISASKDKKHYVSSDKFGGGYFFIWCDAPSYKTDQTIWEETELRTWANASRMWNPEVNSGRSGIRAAVPYSDMKDWAVKMSGLCNKQ